MKNASQNHNLIFIPFFFFHFTQTHLFAFNPRLDKSRGTLVLKNNFIFKRIEQIINKDKFKTLPNKTPLHSSPSSDANSAVRLTRGLECQPTPVGGQIPGSDSVRDHPPHVRTGSLLHPSRLLQGNEGDTALPPAGSRLERHRL